MLSFGFDQLFSVVVVVVAVLLLFSILLVFFFLFGIPIRKRLMLSKMYNTFLSKSLVCNAIILVSNDLISFASLIFCIFFFFYGGLLDYVLLMTFSILYYCSF